MHIDSTFEHCFSPSHQHGVPKPLILANLRKFDTFIKFAFPMRKVMHLCRCSFSFSVLFLFFSWLIDLWFIKILKSLSKLAFCCHTYASPHLLSCKSSTPGPAFILSCAFLTLFMVYFALQKILGYTWSNYYYFFIKFYGLYVFPRKADSTIKL